MFADEQCIHASVPFVVILIPAQLGEQTGVRAANGVWTPSHLRKSETALRVTPTGHPEYSRSMSAIERCEQPNKIGAELPAGVEVYRMDDVLS
jgi:hypothetical protein